MEAARSNQLNQTQLENVKKTAASVRAEVQKANDRAETLNYILSNAGKNVSYIDKIGNYFYSYVKQFGQYFDTNDASVVLTGKNIDGSKTSTSSRFYAAGGLFLGSLVSGKAIENGIEIFTKEVKNSANQTVLRKLVKNEDDLLRIAENAAGGNLDNFTEFKPNWYEGTLEDGTRRRIEWQPGGEEVMGEGPHVKVMEFDPNKGKKGGWRVIDKYFIDGKEKF